MIDYVCTNQENIDKIMNLKTLETPGKSDHLPLQLIMNTTWKHKPKYRKEKKAKITTRTKWNEDKKDEYQKSISEWLQTSKTNAKTKTASLQYRELRNKLTSTAALFKMKKYTGTSFKNEKNNWFNKQCKLKKRDMKKALRKCKQENFKEDLVKEYVEKKERIPRRN